MITITVECDNNLTMTAGSGKGRLRITLPNVDEKKLLEQIESKKFTLINRRNPPAD
jgi:hypothetical protein